jgi:hypothetical protein
LIHEVAGSDFCRCRRLWRQTHNKIIVACIPMAPLNAGSNNYMQLMNLGPWHQTMKLKMVRLIAVLCHVQWFASFVSHVSSTELSFIGTCLFTKCQLQAPNQNLKVDSQCCLILLPFGKCSWLNHLVLCSQGLFSGTGSRTIEVFILDRGWW